MDKLRIAIVAPSLGILGGEAVQAERLLHLWRDEPTIDAWLVPIDPEPRFLRALGRVRYLRALTSETIYLLRLPRHVRRADIVHVFSRSYVWFLLAPMPALLLGRMFRRPVVLHYHNGEAQDHLSRSPTARAAIAQADRIVVPSGYLGDVLNRFGFEATMVANVADLDQFQYRARNPLRPRLLSTRNLHPLYNVECTLRAFRRIQTYRPEAALTLVGRGSAEKGLRELAGQLELTNVRFVGQVKHSAIASYYADHDIYLQSPNVDNVSNSIIEAFASGLPVVSTDAGGVSTILQHERHGLLAPVNDHETLAAHVLRMLDDPDFARRLAESAYETCHRYAWPALRQEWLRLYHSLRGNVAPVAVRCPDGTS